VTPAPTIKPVVQGQVSAAAPPQKTYSLFAPLAITKTLDWATLVTLGLLTILLGVYVLTHVMVWRKGLKRWKKRGYKGLAALQLGGLLIIVLFLLNSGFGRVG
jgi:hypothetical protein